MKKIITTQMGQVHYLAGCDTCNFSAGRNTDETPSPADVRAAVRSHVLKTGHECWIEAGTHTTYHLEGGRTKHAHCPACTCRNEEIVTCALCGTVKSAPQVA